VAKFDWDRAAKDDYIRRHGSIPFWVGLGRDESEEIIVREELDLRKRLSGILELVAQFADLTPFERRRQYELFFGQICRRFDDERAKVVNPNPTFDEAIDEYERGTLSLLKGVLSVPDSDPRPGSARGTKDTVSDV
jgi:hypothetical protein